MEKYDYYNQYYHKGQSMDLLFRCDFASFVNKYYDHNCGALCQKCGTLVFEQAIIQIKYHDRLNKKNANKIL